MKSEGPVYGLRFFCGSLSGKVIAFLNSGPLLEIQPMFKRVMLSALALMVLAGSAAAEEFRDGTHYQVLPEKLPTTYRGNEAGEIMEIFSYSCIHCFNLEPFVTAWKQGKPDDIRFTPVPVIFNPRQIPEAKAYYTGQFLDVINQTHPSIYNEIHINRNRLSSDEDFAEIFERFNVDETEYMNMANSFAVNARVSMAQKITQMSQIQGTPSLVVNGKYLISGQMAGGNERMFTVAEWLVRNDGDL
jgi:thiol:disulfide interchange protein DsbA